MNHGNSGLAHGTGGSPQLTLDNGDMAVKAKENEASTVYSKEQLEAKKQEMLNQQSVVNELQGQFDVLAESYGYTEKLEVIAAKEKELEEVPKRIEDLQKNIVDWTKNLNDLNTLIAISIVAPI